MFESKLHAFSLRFASVESIRQDVAQEALQSQNRSMTFSVAPSIYEDLKAYGRPVGLSSIHALSLNPSSDLSVRECCQLLGGSYQYLKNTIAFTRH